MRLLNVHTLDISEFFDDDIPEYSILSHTWGPEEGTFQQWTTHPSPASSPNRGFKKIISACKLSREDRIDYIWVDTVCINKVNNVELDEALNSMWAWYRDAKVCYACLEDFEYVPSKSLFSGLAASRWFTRGWTLQELLAPRLVKFCDRTWTVFGTKASLSREISKITGIGGNVLEAASKIKRESVAQRMSWLANRRTTRREDMAYCMLGIFDISMVPIYGEGKKAFVRLQEEVMKSFNDQTIFCWTWPEEMPREAWTPVLAPSPAAFRHSGAYVVDHRRQWENMRGYSSINNLAIKADLPIMSSTEDQALAVLDVRRSDDPSDHAVAIPLVKLPHQPRWGTGPTETAWRADYPTGPVLLPASWGSAPRDLFLARPGLAPIGEDPTAGTTTYSTESWPQQKLSPFATMVLQNVDLETEQVARLALASHSRGPHRFFKPTRSPRIWHQSVEVSTTGGTYSVHLAVWLRPDGKACWRVGLDALEPHAPVSVIESQVASWSNKVEFRVSGQGVDGVACFEFAEDGMDMVQHKLGSATGPVVRPASFSVHLPRRRGFLE